MQDIFLFQKLSLLLLLEMETMEKFDEQPMEVLMDFFCRMMPLDEHDKEVARGCFEPCTYKRRELLLNAGEPCRHYMFVVKGCLRMYSEDTNGNRHIIKFAPEGAWMTDIDSFFHPRNSLLYIDALENTLVMQAEVFPLVGAFMRSVRLNNIFRVLAENELSMLQRRHLQTLSSTAEERYQSFCEHYPQLLNRIPQTQIAAYLGVTPEFFSRMKSRMLRGEKGIS